MLDRSQTTHLFFQLFSGRGDRNGPKCKVLRWNCPEIASSGNPTSGHSIYEIYSQFLIDIWSHWVFDMLAQVFSRSTFRMWHCSWRFIWHFLVFFLAAVLASQHISADVFRWMCANVLAYFLPDILFGILLWNSHVDFYLSGFVVLLFKIFAGIVASHAAALLAVYFTCHVVFYVTFCPIRFWHFDWHIFVAICVTCPSENKVALALCGTFFCIFFWHSTYMKWNVFNYAENTYYECIYGRFSKMSVRTF